MVFKLVVVVVIILQHVLSKNADFSSNKTLTTIAFGSCNKHDREQPLWKSIIQQNPDIWIWLGDVVYADTRIVPFIWMASTLDSMKEKFDLQRQRIEYKAFLDTGVPVIGVWDDHDYGLDGGGKSFKYRFQSQKMFLDFLDQPLESPLRKREGIYSSYSYGTGDKVVKIILLDVRSHHVKGSSCDVLGIDQWNWLDEQLKDDNPNLVLVGTGKQVLSDIPFIDKWMSCPSSLDKLIWLAQRQPRVMFLSGDVHFSEINCLNSSGTGYPLFEVTSSGLTHSCSASLLPSGVCHWTLKNVVASRYRVSNVVTDKSYGILQIDWETKPVTVTVKLMGEEKALSKHVISLDDLKVSRQPAVCPAAIEQPNWYLQRLFWCSVVLGVIIVALIVLRITFAIGRWIAVELLKDLDMNIKRRIKKLRANLSSYKLQNAERKKPHNE